jgi:hypothetical protein
MQRLAAILKLWWNSVGPSEIGWWLVYPPRSGETLRQGRIIRLPAYGDQRINL